MEAEPPKADLPKRERRWFQFSLRSLMIGVTLLAVPLGYVGWQAKIVRDRREAAATYQMIPGIETTFGPLHVLRMQRPQAPWPLRWLGEEGYWGILAGDTASDDEIANLKRLFPEAEVRRSEEKP